jgi:hypothetical protein
MDYSAATASPTYRTNNDLEHHFGSVRYGERRASGRKGASPAMVVRGSVRVVAAVATPPGGFDAQDIRPTDLKRWRTMRASLERDERIAAPSYASGGIPKPTSAGRRAATQAGFAALVFSLVLGVRGGDPPLGPHPSNSEQPRKRCPNGLP